MSLRYCVLLAFYAILVPEVLSGEEIAFEARLARRFSPELRRQETDLLSVERELPSLPMVPLADQGGTGGFACLHPLAEPSKEEEYSVSIRFEAEASVDMVVLVPARRYGVGGLDPEFGIPDAFQVDLLDEDGQPFFRVAEKQGIWTNPVRSGHPFVLPVEPPRKAAGLRISANRLRLDPDISDGFVHAWAEAFVFEGERNVAKGGAVETSGGSPSPAPWQWGNGFLVDGQTPLGLPEIPAGVHENVGWMSNARAMATDSVWIELDLGKICKFDALRLYPAKRPTSDLPSGFGFPRRFVVSVFSGSGVDPKTKASVTRKFVAANPGHNPVLVPLGPCEGRSIQIDIEELWKAYESFPAFAALSEVEVVNGEVNLATRAAVRTAGGMGTIVGSGAQFWSPSSLTDGFGPDGRLVSTRSWLLSLGRSLELEERRFQLKQDTSAIVATWRRGLWIAMISAVGLGTAMLVALPIRYHLRGRREVAGIRERIAGDLHDEVGSNLGSIQMFADLAERRSGPSGELKRIQRIAAETVSAVRDIVWLLKPEGDHRIGTVEHLRETCSIMLEGHEWRFNANEAAWNCEMSDEANRHLFLFLRESLHNILRHAEASVIDVKIECSEDQFRFEVIDDGRGISPERLQRPSTLRALRQRAEALKAEFAVLSDEGEGTRLELVIPLQGGGRNRGRRFVSA